MLVLASLLFQLFVGINREALVEAPTHPRTD